MSLMVAGYSLTYKNEFERCKILRIYEDRAELPNKNTGFFVINTL